MGYFKLDSRPLNCSSFVYLPGGLPSSDLPRVHIRWRGACVQPMDLRCETCDSTFATKRGFVRHQLRHTRVLTCDVCYAYTSIDAASIAYHKRVRHLGTRPFSCAHCDYAGRNAAALRAHQRNIHCDERPYACPSCSFTTKTFWYLKQHATRHGLEVLPPR